MFRSMLRSYFVYIVTIPLLAAAAFALAVFEHGATKQYTKWMATMAPLTFSVAAMLVMFVMGIQIRSRVTDGFKRLLIGVAAGSVVIGVTFLKAEQFYAPVAYFEGAGVDTVVARIATDEDLDRFRAWSRLVTMSLEDKQAVARALAPLLVGEDARARHSAEMTVGISLKRQSLVTLTALTPLLREHLSGSKDPRGDRAAEYARRFVDNNLPAISKALKSPKDAAELPEGAIPAVITALACEAKVGPIYLREIAKNGDDWMRPIADDLLDLTGWKS